jgi:hypothetical protein
MAHDGEIPDFFDSAGFHLDFISLNDGWQATRLMKIADAVAARISAGTVPVHTGNVSMAALCLRLAGITDLA